MRNRSGFGGNRFATLARIFHELLWRDDGDGRATAQTIAECGFNKNRGDIVDEWLCVFFMTMFDLVDELSEGI